MHYFCRQNKANDASFDNIVLGDEHRYKQCFGFAYGKKGGSTIL